jgi:hypothetical protein
MAPKGGDRPRHGDALRICTQILVQGLPTGLKTARVARQRPRGETAQRRRRRCQIAPRAPATLKAGKTKSRRAPASAARHARICVPQSRSSACTKADARPNHRPVSALAPAPVLGLNCPICPSAISGAAACTACATAPRLGKTRAKGTASSPTSVPCVACRCSAATPRAVVASGGLGRAKISAASSPTAASWPKAKNRCAMAPTTNGRAICGPRIASAAV